MSELISTKKQKARKRHICDWCKHDISKGDIYLRATVVDGGDINTWKSHLYCEELTKRLNMFDEGEISSWDFDIFVYEFLRENLSEDEYEDIDTYPDKIKRACELLKIPMKEE